MSLFQYSLRKTGQGVGTLVSLIYIHYKEKSATL
jgi:hypothetical protein